MPRILSGGRTESRASVVMLAWSTPTAKKEKALAASPSRTSEMERSMLSVGSPSVMRMTQGRK